MVACEGRAAGRSIIRLRDSLFSAPESRRADLRRPPCTNPSRLERALLALGGYARDQAISFDRLKGIGPRTSSFWLR